MCEVSSSPVLVDLPFSTSCNGCSNWDRVIRALSNRQNAVQLKDEYHCGCVQIQSNVPKSWLNDIAKTADVNIELLELTSMMNAVSQPFGDISISTQTHPLFHCT